MGLLFSFPQAMESAVTRVPPGQSFSFFGRVTSSSSPLGKFLFITWQVLFCNRLAGSPICFHALLQVSLPRWKQQTFNLGLLCRNAHGVKNRVNPIWACPNRNVSDRLHSVCLGNQPIGRSRKKTSPLSKFDSLKNHLCGRTRTPHTYLWGKSNVMTWKGVRRSDVWVCLQSLENGLREDTSISGFGANIRSPKR